MNEESFKHSLTHDEKRWMLRGMITTRAVDNALKRLFMSGEIQYEGKSFQGKGFRSLGQEAIYTAALRLNRKSPFDIVASLIRDLGVVLAFTNDDIDLAINAQAAKDGPPMGGRDLHLIKNYSTQLIEEKICTRDELEGWKQSAVTKCEEAIAQGIADVFLSHPNTLVLGEDVAAPYGNAFMMFKSLMGRFSDRFYNMPIAEGAIIGACVGLALEGMRPIGEMQFNDFVASGFNELVNNAAKFYYRVGRPVPTTPYDARALLNASVLESIASQMSEQLFEYLDAPVYVRGSLDTPIPYSPPLEEAYLLSPEQILSSARELLAY